MPTPEWPQRDFLDWLDATKRRLGLERDAHLADHLGIGHTLISNWRSNKQRPSMETLNKVANVLHEDPRRLWVLAGWTNAVDVGLLAGDTATVEPPLPDEIAQLIALFRDERLDDDDRRYFLRAVRGVCQGVLADLNRRHQPPAPPRLPKHPSLTRARTVTGWAKPDVRSRHAEPSRKDPQPAKTGLYPLLSPASGEHHMSTPAPAQEGQIPHV